MQAGEPDIVHVHNTSPVNSPRADRLRSEEGAIPVVRPCSYRLLCPAATLFRDGRVCVGEKMIPSPGSAHGCFRSSRARDGRGAARIVLPPLSADLEQGRIGIQYTHRFARRKFSLESLASSANPRQTASFKPILVPVRAKAALPLCRAADAGYRRAASPGVDFGKIFLQLPASGNCSARSRRPATNSRT